MILAVSFIKLHPNTIPWAGLAGRKSGDHIDRDLRFLNLPDVSSTTVKSKTFVKSGKRTDIQNPCYCQAPEISRTLSETFCRYSTGLILS